jgi:hypothetical protein
MNARLEQDCRHTPAVQRLPKERGFRADPGSGSRADWPSLERDAYRSRQDSPNRAHAGNAVTSNLEGSIESVTVTNSL